MKGDPNWICHPCGVLYTSRRSVNIDIATYHTPDPDDPDDVCGWCGTNKEALTSPRDYAYPQLKRKSYAVETKE